MIPIQDEDRVGGFPAMTYLLVAANVIVFLTETERGMKALSLTPIRRPARVAIRWG